MKHIWTVLCQSSSTDTETKLLSIFNCLEALNMEVDKTKLTPGNKIMTPISFQMISFWSLEDFDKASRLEIRVELVSPEGEILNKFEKEYEVKKGTKRFRNSINFNGLTVVGSGRYIMRVNQKNMSSKKFEVVSEIPLDLDILYKSFK